MVLRMLSVFVGWEEARRILAKILHVNQTAGVPVCMRVTQEQVVWAQN